MKTHPSHAKGFTLIESAVVMVILGVMFGMTVPAFRSFQRSHLLQAGTESVVGQLRLARQKAIGMQHEQRLTFSTGPDRYSVEDQVTLQTFGPFTFPKEIALDRASLV